MIGEPKCLCLYQSRYLHSVPCVQSNYEVQQQNRNPSNNATETSNIVGTAVITRVLPIDTCKCGTTLSYGLLNCKLQLPVQSVLKLIRKTKDTHRYVSTNYHVKLQRSIRKTSFNYFTIIRYLQSQRCAIDLTNASYCHIFDMNRLFKTIQAIM